MTRSRHWLSLAAIWLLPGPSERTWKRRMRRRRRGSRLVFSLSLSLSLSLPPSLSLSLPLPLSLSPLSHTHSLTHWGLWDGILLTPTRIERRLTRIECRLAGKAWSRYSCSRMRTRRAYSKQSYKWRKIFFPRLLFLFLPLVIRRNSRNEIYSKEEEEDAFEVQRRETELGRDKAAAAGI